MNVIIKLGGVAPMITYPHPTSFITFFKERKLKMKKKEKKNIIIIILTSDT